MNALYVADVTLVWERPEPRPRRTLAPLSRDAIVAAAVRLADCEGLESVSIRKVAAALDAGPMRLYGYLATKQELLDLMVDAVHAEIEQEDPGVHDWRDTLRSVARTTRRAALQHEWLVDLLGGRPHLGPHALAVLEISASALAHAPGLADADADDLWPALGTLNAYVVGAMRREIAERRATLSTGVDESGWQTAAGPYLQRTFAAGRFPTLARLVHDGAHVDPEDAFEQGLTYILDRIAGLDLDADRAAMCPPAVE